jgi:hypothetical protein
VEVIYERDPDVGNGFQAYRGRMQWGAGVEEFTGVHFEALLRLLNEKLPDDDMDLVFIRSDRQDLQPYPLKQELVLLIKTDVEKAIQEMSHPDVRIVVGRPPAPPAVLKSCGDTLAGAFGEEVLVRIKEKPADVVVQDGGVTATMLQGWTHGECPGCGQWTPITVRLYEQVYVLLLCEKCAVDFQIKVVSKEWAAASVPQLLSTTLTRFFLPREWNNYQPWVSREKLQALYTQFMKTKEQFNVR